MPCDSERQLAAHQRVPDELVERVVAADVLAQRDDRARRIEQARRMQTTRLLEHGLLRLQGRGEPPERLAAHPKIDGADVVLPCTATASIEALPQTPQLDVI